ncbi:hypothetical protein Dsin_015553, partial [Dipteronia sinensis]
MLGTEIYATCEWILFGRKFVMRQSLEENEILNHGFMAVLWSRQKYHGFKSWLPVLSLTWPMHLGVNVYIHPVSLVSVPTKYAFKDGTIKDVA